MAIFHFSAQVITRSDGGNAVAAAAYRAGMRFICTRTGLVFNHSRKTEVAHRAILAPEGAAPWVFDRLAFWTEVEKVENRVNSQLAREVEVSLPIELSQEQQVALLHSYVKSQFVDRGMVADVALHAKPGNPHAHILLSLRDVVGTSFGGKRRDWNDRALMPQWREAWATACNASLELAGQASRIDHRSHKALGLDEPATVHQGRRTPTNVEAWNGRATYNAWVQTQTALAKTRLDVQRVQSQIVDLTTTLAQALAERKGQCFATTVSERTPATAVAKLPPRIWTTADAVPSQDFSIAGLLARRVAPSFSPIHRSTTPPKVLHASDDYTQGENLC